MTTKGAALAALAAGAALGALLLAPSRVAGADAVVGGCNEMLPGEIGIREATADVGDTVAVAVTVHTVDTLDAFSLDVDFPSRLLSFVSAEPGLLTDHFLFFGGRYLAADDQVRLSGTEIDLPIGAGSAGVLAIVRFEVLTAGVGAFGTGDYLDDISAYAACEDAHGTSPVEPHSWGRVKARYSSGRVDPTAGRTSRNTTP